MTLRHVSAWVVATFLASAAFGYANVGPTTPTTPSTGKQVSSAFMQWCHQTVGTPVQCNTLSCRTNNSGAQVCGGRQGVISSAISKQFGAIGCHSNNNTSIFPTRVHGLAAHAALLRVYCGQNKRCTPDSVVSRWAEGSHSTYAALIERITGMNANQVFDPNNPDTIGKLVTAMSRMEAGRFAHPCDDIAKGVAAAFGAVGDLPAPSNIGAVLAGAGGMQGLSTLVEGNAGSGQLFSNLGQQYSGFQPWNSSSTAQSPQGGSPSGTTTATSGGSQADPNAALYQALMNAQQNQQSTFTPTDSGTIEPEDMLITCDNGTVEWSCDPSDTLSRGLSKPSDPSFKTRGALVGSLRVAPGKQTTYTVQCLKKQRITSEGSCTVSPHREKPSSDVDASKPVLTIDADSDEVQRGKSVMISWAAVKVDSCVVYGEGLSEEGTEGSASTDDLFTRGTATYVLECRTEAGDTLSKSVDVEVR